MPNKTNTLLKPYNIVLNDDDNSATIDMYGEVVETHPVDWWTGEPISGNFIALDDFLNDLKSLEGKSSITVHINSVGGSFYAGLAIYNRLRSLGALGANITTINDSLAASAGSIIFMAGDTRKAYAGSNLMVHGVMGFLYGYYNVGDLKTTIKTLQAHDKALVAVYKEATGLDEETIRSAISKDTYMTGQEAVDNGWAHEVIGSEGEDPVNVKLNPTKSHLMANGHAVAACIFGKLPENIQTMTEDEWAEMSTPESGAEPHDTSEKPAQQARNNTHSNNGGNEMDIKNLDDLRTAHPDLVAQIVADAHATAIQNERNRLADIEAIEASVGDAELVKNAKYGENPMTAEQLGYAAMKKHAELGTNMVNAMKKDAEEGGANAAAGASATEDELTDDEKATNLLLGAVNKKKEGK